LTLKLSHLGGSHERKRTYHIPIAPLLRGTPDMKRALGSGRHIIAFHYPCPDGIFAALAATLHFRQRGVPVHYAPNRVFAPCTVESLQLTVGPPDHLQPERGLASNPPTHPQTCVPASLGGAAFWPSLESICLLVNLWVGLVHGISPARRCKRDGGSCTPLGFCSWVALQSCWANPGGGGGV